MTEVNSPKLLLTPGQGSFTEGLYGSYAHIPEFVDSFELADKIGIELFGTEQVAGKSLSEHAQRTGQAELSSNTIIAQPLIVTAAVGLIKHLKNEETFTTAYGHSLGELAALFAAGCLSEADAIRLAMMRGIYSDEASQQIPGGMAALMNMPHEIKERFHFGNGEEVDEVVIATENHPDEFTIAGPKEKVSVIVTSIRDRYQKVRGLTKEERRMLPNAIVLGISGGFHSWMLRGAQKDWAAELKGVNFNTPEQMNFFSSHSHRYEGSPDVIKQHLVDQLIHPVKFWYDIGLLINDGHLEITESGPNNILIRGLRLQQSKTRLPAGLKLLSAHEALTTKTPVNSLQNG